MKIILIGDICSRKQESPYQPESDYVFANLEGPLGGTTLHPTPRWSWRFGIRSAPEPIKNMNLTTVSLANNHIYDFGKEGVDITKKYLDQWGVGYTGVFGDGTYNITNGVGLLAYSWHVWPMTTSGHLDGVGARDIKRQEIRRDINLIRKSCDTIIVSLHWGYEGEPYPLPSQKRLAHDIIDWGADIIAGAHPHIPSGIERYRDGIIAYSLGTFLWDVDNSQGGWKLGDQNWALEIDSQTMDYNVKVYCGDNVAQTVDRISKEVSLLNYDKQWSQLRIRKNLPNKVYPDTFDTF